MNILIVTQYFWPESFLVNGLAMELQQKGHQVTVLTGLPNYPKGKFTNGYGFFSGPWTEMYNGVKVLRIPISPRGTGYFNLVVNYISFVFFGTFFSIFRKPKNVDVIFCFAVSPITTCLPAIFIRWLTKKPLVLWVQDLWPESISAVGAIKSESVLNTVGRLVKFIYQRCDLILIQSEAFRLSILKWGGKNCDVKYLPNWAEPFVVKSELPEWVQSLPKQVFKIGFAGNIGKAQDMFNLVEAADLLRDQVDIRWIVVGDGSEKKWLDEEIEKRKLRHVVFTTGQKPYSDMLPFFENCDAMLVSLTDKDIFSLTIPSKIQAYMAASRPIIAAVGGEGARIVESAKAGLTVAPQDPKQLAAAVLKMKELDLEQRKSMGQNGFKFFNQNFEKNVVINNFESYLENTLKNYP